MPTERQLLRPPINFWINLLTKAINMLRGFKAEADLLAAQLNYRLALTELLHASGQL